MAERMMDNREIGNSDVNAETDHSHREKVSSAVQQDEEPEPLTKKDAPAGFLVSNYCSECFLNKEKLEKSEKERKDLVAIGQELSETLQFNMLENQNLRKENKELKEKLEQRGGEDVKDGLEKLSVNNDKEKVESTTNSTQDIPDEILPSVSKELRPTFDHCNPYKCPASCVMSVVFFIMRVARKKLCPIKFPKEIQRQLDEWDTNLESFGGSKNKNKDEGQMVRNCSLSLEDLKIVGLIADQPVFSSGPINGVDELDEAIKSAIKIMCEEKLWLELIVVDYQESKVGSHCMAIRRLRDSVVLAQVYDAQTGKLWPRSDKYFRSINQFKIHKIDKIVAEKLTEKCGLHLCKEEHLVATSSGEVTGVVDCLFDDCELSDLDFYNEQ